MRNRAGWGAKGGWETLRAVRGSDRWLTPAGITRLTNLRGTAQPRYADATRVNTEVKIPRSADSKIPTLCNW
ncbi:MAG: hypothetical protein OXC84_10245 [Gammaproteobacteria bacterium]|nr:hypothetical protein [Gammaproteobacteria bacterium]